MNQTSSYNLRIFLALLTVQILFGINYVVSKVIVGIFPPLVWASIRLIISAAALFTIAYISGRKRPELNKDFLKPLVLFSLLGVLINQGSFLVGLKYTTATNSAILNTLIPVFTLLLVTITGKEPLTTRRAVGFLSALTGVLAIRKIENFTLSDTTLIGDFLTILNCFSYALFLTISKKFLERYDSMWTTTWMFIFGSIGFTAAAAPSWIDFQWPQMDIRLISAMAFSILGSTLLAYLLNIWALARAQSSSVALFIYLQPVVASILAWFSFGEVITLRTFLSSLLIFAGMLLSLSRKEAVKIESDKKSQTLKTGS